MPRAADVIACARSWRGTPYHDQASLKGVGCDCLGLLRGVWRELIGEETWDLPPYTRDWGEVGGRELLLEAGRRYCRREQPGNPRPRVFRLPRDGAIINRFGLNSDGLAAISGRLRRRRGRPGIVGVNLGANKESPDRIADYVMLVTRLCGLAQFLTINISSPNTPGLRDLQGEAFLDELLARCTAARDEADAAIGSRTALLIKIAPDMDEAALDGLVATVCARGIDGMIVSNTTIARPAGLTEKAMAGEAGGLSGRPLFLRSTRVLAQTALRVEGRVPLIGVGGIDSPQAAIAKLRAGASLLQLYSALVYQGPGLVGAIKQGICDHLERTGAAGLTDLIGRDVADSARDPRAALAAAGADRSA